MRRRIKTILLTYFFIASALVSLAQENTDGFKLQGKVTDAESGEALPGVNIMVKGKMSGTTSDANGEFIISLKRLPVSLIFTRIDRKTKEIEVTSATNLFVVMEEQSVLGRQIVISASRVEEEILRSPVTVEKLNSDQIRNVATDDYYKAIANLKGVDLIQSSVNYTVLNARGFNATGNGRMVQFTDGIDTQLPSLNLSAANLNGPTELDVESIEFLPGTSSALYGPNAFNGVIVQTTKSPFDYQGLSARAKVGVNHIDDSDFISEGQRKMGPGSPQPMYEASLRYAKAFNDRFAFKIGFSYSEAENWVGTTFNDRNSGLKPEGFNFNPAADRIFSSGDEVTASLGLIKLQLGSNANFLNSPLAPLLPFLPNHLVSRTGYDESSLVDYNTYSAKINAALHYRFFDNLELSYSLNAGKASTIINAAQRTPVEGFSMQHHKLELKSHNFFIRTYAALPDAGKAYSGDLTGVLINNSWKPHATWFQQYSLAYLTSLATQSSQAGFNPNNVGSQEIAHQAARLAADQGRLLPGTPEFEQVKNEITANTIPIGSRIKDNTKMYHADAQYDFSKLFKPVGIQVGGSYRLFDLNSNGTLFADTSGNDIAVQEFGAYVMGTKKILDERIKITASLRYDKNENFKAQFNPRASVVFSPYENHHFRIAYQTGFRNPTLQGQHVDFNAVSLRILGGLPQYAEARNVFENAFLLSSVQQFSSAVSQQATPAAPGLLANLDLLVPVTRFEPVKPEEIRSIEVGYRTVLGEKLSLDIVYYYNRYNDFIAQRTIRKASALIDLDAPMFTVANAVAASSLLSPVTTPGKENTFSIYTNVDDEVTAQGLAAGFEYSLPANFLLGANYNWNKLNEEIGNGFISEFNTPEQKFNVSISNSRLTEKLGFNVVYRWQEKYLFESTFAKGEVPSFGLVDAQVSYKVPLMKSIVKVGGSNAFNKQYIPNYGAPTIGAIYYVSVTFNQLMK
jgi:outer membrane receptor protein involved in Fe transport